MQTMRLHKLFPLFFTLLLTFTHTSKAESIDETRNVLAFTKIEAGGLVNIELIQGDKHQVKIWARGIALSDILTKNTKDTLVVTTQGNHRGEKIRIQVTYVELEEIKTSGAAIITASNAIAADTLNIYITGNGDADLNLDVKNVNVDMRGNGNLTLKGRAKNQHTKSHGGRGSLNNSKLKN
jgi:hypothetical protein